MPTAALNGITVAYDLVGSGPHTLLLVHGHPFNRSMWAPQLQALALPGWQILAPDLRGYGATTVVPGTTTLGVFATDLVALLDCLGVQEFTIGGLSMGGQIAMEVCRQVPGRVRGAILAATFPRPETAEGKVARCTMADRLMHEGMRPYATEVLDKMLAPQTIAVQPDVAQRVMTMMEGTNPAGAAAALRGRAERPAYEPTLASLRIPALVVVGDEDAYTTRRDTDIMHDLLPGSELLWLKGVGHMPNLEAPGPFNEAVTRLLQRVSAGHR